MLTTSFNASVITMPVLIYMYDRLEDETWLILL